MSSETKTHRASVLLSRKFRRIVVKIGSGVLADAEAGLRVPHIRALAGQVARAWEERGIAFVVVTSGAVAAGRKKMGMAAKPRTMTLKQAAAAVGQTSLMYAYERAFERRGRKVGQLLLTHEDFESRERYNNARNTVEALLSRGIVPIINENDTVATEEIRLGDNDHLAALVTQMIGADLLILLTDNEGVFTRDPHRFADAQRIPVIGTIDEELLRVASTQRTQAMGTGGMASKLLAARVVSESGTPVVCNDFIACTLDQCNPANGQCTYTPFNTFCDNGNKCDGDETCKNVKIVPRAQDRPPCPSPESDRPAPNRRSRCRSPRSFRPAATAQNSRSERAAPLYICSHSLSVGP